MIKSTTHFSNRALLLIALLAPLTQFAQSNGDASLAKAAQNPVADMISVPFQNGIKK